MNGMTAEIVTIGTEIIIGDIVNTHAQYLSQKLASIGISVLYHSSVGDNPARMQEVLRHALTRCDLVIVTGGLGPTTDDLTKETICEMLEIPLVEDPRAKTEILEFFRRRGISCTENNMKQAMVPENGVIFYNKYGTAPGMAVQKGTSCVIMLPGPPKELRPMFDEQAFPYLKQFSDREIVSHHIRFFGLGESTIADRLGSLTDSSDPTLALYAKEGEVSARITACRPTWEEAEAAMLPMMDTIRSMFGNDIYGIDAESLEQVVVRELLSRKCQIATAESCTGGLLAQKITSVPGASDCFQYGLVSYSNTVKYAQLGVPEWVLRKYTAVSRQTAFYMAKGALKNSGADIALAVTGLAGPGGGTPEQPVGTVYLAAATRQYTWVRHLTLGHGKGNERDMIRNVAAKNALDMARRILKNNSSL